MAKKIKSFLNLICLIGFLIPASSYSKQFLKFNTNTDLQSSEPSNKILRGGGGGEPGPWPLGPELPFPWDDIEGIWSGTIDGLEIVFSFEVIENNLGQRQISVKEIDPTTGEPILAGIGTESDKVVRAIMTAGRKKKYYLTIRQVKDETCQEDKTVTIVTVQSMSINDYVYLFAIQKISNTPLTQAMKYNYNNPHFRNKNIDFNDSNPFCFFK